MDNPIEPVGSPGQQHHIEKLDAISRRRINRVLTATEAFVKATMEEPTHESTGNHHEGIEFQDALIELVYGTKIWPASISNQGTYL